MTSIPKDTDHQGALPCQPSPMIPAGGPWLIPSPNPLVAVTSSLPWTMDTPCGPSRENNWHSRALRHSTNYNGVPARSSRPRRRSPRYPRVLPKYESSSMRLTWRRKQGCSSRRRRANRRVVRSLGLLWLDLRNRRRGKSRSGWSSMGGMVARMRTISSRRRLRLRRFSIQRRY